MGLQFAKALEPYGLYFLEEPCWPETMEDIALIQRAVKTPIATGERLVGVQAFRELFERRAASVVQPDITHFGGILETKKLAAWADAYYVLVAPHNVGGPVSTAANLHLAACTTNFKIQEHFNDFAEDFVLKTSLQRGFECCRFTSND